MKNKLVFAAGMAAGFVLGARAGRDSYEQIKTKAQELWGNPKVQETVSSTAETIKNKAPEVQDAVKDGLKNIGSDDNDGAKAPDKPGKDSSATGKSPSATSGNATNGTSGNKTTGTSGTGTGPSGGDPRTIEDTPFTAQDEDTRPDLGQ